MATIVRLPEVLTGMTEAVVLAWHVEPGDQIVAGQPLAEVETEKAVVDCPAEDTGTVAGFLVGLGEPVTPGTPIAVLADAGESLDQAMSAAGGGTPVSGGTVPGDTVPGGTVPGDTAPGDTAPGGTVPGGNRDPAELPGRRLFASPLVRRLARERGIDLSQVLGSGPGHRIVRRDLARLSRGGPEPALGEPALREPAAPPPTPVRQPAPAAPAGPTEFVDIPHTAMRRAIARRLTQSKSTVPHFYLSADCRVDALLDLRRAVNEQAAIRISVNDLVVKAVATAFQDVPEANVIWTPEATRRFGSVAVAVAVAVEGGLVTPVVRNVERRSLTDVSAAIADLAARARAGRLQQAELEGGSFAVSNLGMYGIEQFAAIINPPQSGILAVGAASKRPAVGEDGELGVATVMTVTLSGDHRVLDGALGAQWLGALKRRIEHPLTILI
jgi:pyruvate dehydrogenase E2 component (dihydrolipoamide acetyltransferase)